MYDSLRGLNMKKPYPALCRDCKYGLPEDIHSWTLRCHHPVINANDPYALANLGVKTRGSECSKERSKKGPFTRCGITGKLWEPE